MRWKAFQKVRRNPPQSDQTEEGCLLTFLICIFVHAITAQLAVSKTHIKNIYKNIYNIYIYIYIYICALKPLYFMEF